MRRVQQERQLITVEPGVPIVKRRPKDRKQQILEQAVRLFIERGFHSVKLEDIAEASGVTARALYRHYDNKQALLAAAIRTGQEQYLTARQSDELDDSATHLTLSTELPSLISAAVASRSLTVLWQREARYLDGTERAEVRRRINAIVAGMQAAIHQELPELSPPQAELRAWAVSSIITSLGRHNLSLPRDELQQLLFDAGMAAAQTPPTASLEPLEGTPDDSIGLFSRSETLLAAGARLFRSRGYPAVSTSEIGNGAGIAGPGLYRSFSSKQAILDTLIRRLDEWCTLESLRALHSQPTAPGRLCALVAGRVRVSLDSPDLVAVAITELPHASAEVRDAFVRNETDRHALWIDLIRTLDPDRTATQAKLLVAAAISFIEDVARTWHLTRRVGVADEIAEIAMGILTSRAATLPS